MNFYISHFPQKKNIYKKIKKEYFKETFNSQIKDEICKRNEKKRVVAGTCEGVNERERVVARIA